MRTLTLLAVCTTAVSLTAGPTFVANLPNLYQHQKSPDTITGMSAMKPATVPSYDETPNWWEPGGGWCCTTAVGDLFYAMQTNEFSDKLGLFFDAKGKTWYEYMIYGLEKMAEDYFYNNKGFHTMIKDRGFEKNITYREYYWDSKKDHIYQSLTPTDFCAVCNPDPKGNRTPFATMFDMYSYWLPKGGYIALEMIAEKSKISDKQLADRDLWWGRSYHVIAGAGLDGTTIYFADPNENRTGKNKGAGWGHRYDSKDAEPITKADYASYKFDGNYFDKIGEETYDDVRIVRAIVLTAVPEPSTIFLVGAGAGLFLLQIRRRTGRS